MVRNIIKIELSHINTNHPYFNKEKLINERKKANKNILKNFTLEEQLLLKRLLKNNQ